MAKFSKFSNKKEIIEIEGEVIIETDLAIMINAEGGDEIWLPKSQLEDWPDVGDEGEILLPRWLAEEKELI